MHERNSLRERVGHDVRGTTFSFRWLAVPHRQHPISQINDSFTCCQVCILVGTERLQNLNPNRNSEELAVRLKIIWGEGTFVACEWDQGDDLPATADYEGRQQLVGPDSQRTHGR